MIAAPRAHGRVGAAAPVPGMIIAATWEGHASLQATSRGHDKVSMSFGREVVLGTG